MSIRSDAHFGVEGQSLEDAVQIVRDCLSGFDWERYGVASLRVEPGKNDNVVIALVMASATPAQADRDAWAATRAINDILHNSPHSSHWSEGQRELTLA
jgi:hypothetical protein